MAMATSLYMLDEDDDWFQYSKVSSLVSPGEVTTVGAYQFYGFSFLKSIYIYSHVTKIGNYAFASCGTAIIYCEATSQPSGWATYWNISDLEVKWGI
jgi:hypothetical protein